jgi:hypothetical protein
MRRSNRDLTWRSIHRQWSSSVKRQDDISKRAGDDHHKSPSTPLLVVNQPLLHSSELEEISKSQCLNNYQDPSNLLRASDSDIIRSELRTIASQVATLTQCIQQQEKDHKISQDWQFLAMVIDRLCFILFIIFIIIFAIQILIGTKFYEF